MHRQEDSTTRLTALEEKWHAILQALMTDASRDGLPDMAAAFAAVGACYTTGTLGALRDAVSPLIHELSQTLTANN